MSVTERIRSITASTSACCPSRMKTIKRGQAGLITKETRYLLQEEYGSPPLDVIAPKV